MTNIDDKKILKGKKIKNWDNISHRQHQVCSLSCVAERKVSWDRDRVERDVLDSLM